MYPIGKECPMSERAGRQHVRLAAFFEKHDVYQLENELRGRKYGSSTSIDGLCVQMNNLSLVIKPRPDNVKEKVCSPLQTEKDSINIMKFKGSPKRGRRVKDVTTGVEDENIDPVLSEPGVRVPIVKANNTVSRIPKVKKFSDMQILPLKASEEDYTKYYNYGSNVEQAKNVETKRIDTLDKCHSAVAPNNEVAEDETRTHESTVVELVSQSTTSCSQRPTKSERRTKRHRLLRSWRSSPRMCIFNVSHYAYANEV